MSKFVSPLFGHVTASREWNMLADDIALSLNKALQPDADARTRHTVKARYQRLARRRRALLDAAQAEMAAFDAKTAQVAEMRRHAFATAPKGGVLRVTMN